MPKQDPQRELLKRDLKTKEVYHFINDDENVDRKSKEVFKKRHEQIHYPFYRDGTQRYRNIDRIRYVGVSPADLRGVSNSWSKGYGFTANLNPIIYYLEENFPGVSRITVSRTATSSIDAFEMILNTADLDVLFSQIKPLRDRHSSEIRLAANNALAEIVPNDVAKKAEQYFQGDMSRLIRDHSVKRRDLSKDDIETVLGVLSSQDDALELESRELLFVAREGIDRIYIEAVEQEFLERLKQKTDTKRLEDRWQEFFQRHSWIFSHLFAYPAILFQDQAYMGGKTVRGVGGRFADFLYQNDLTDNVAITEIKTHRTRLLDAKAYRGDDVFPPSKELSGAMNQVLDQKDKLQKEFFVLAQAGDFQAFDPECLLVVGMFEDLSDKQRKSFELYRRNSRNVSIVTFDEVHRKMKLLLEVFKDADQKGADAH